MTYRTGTRDPELRATEQRLLKHLQHAQADRGQRLRQVTGYDQLDRPVVEVEWKTHERNLMFRLVNDYRELRHLPAAQLGEVRTIEDSCVGRVDYSTRFTVLLARLAHGLPAGGLA